MVTIIKILVTALLESIDLIVIIGLSFSMHVTPKYFDSCHLSDIKMTRMKVIQLTQIVRITKS